MLCSLEMVSSFTGDKGNYYWTPSRIYNGQEALAETVQIQGLLHSATVSSSVGGGLPFMKDA